MRDASTYRSARRNRAHDLKKEAADVGMKLTLGRARAAVAKSAVKQPQKKKKGRKTRRG